MAFDPNSPASTHNALSDIDAIRNNLNELRKHEASDTEPSNYTPGMLWYDTSNNILKLRNEANTGWQSIWDFSNARVAADGVQSSSIKAGTTAVVVSSNDTTKGYLNGKLIISSPLTGTENNDGGAETFTIALPNSSIGQNQLKTTNGTWQSPVYDPQNGDKAILVGGVTTSSYVTSGYWVSADLSGSGTIFTIPGGEYAFTPQIKRTGTIPSYDWLQSRYVTASGTEHWVFLLTKDNQIISAWEAPDHPSYGNGDDPDVVPHPFADYWNKPLPEGHEIVLLDMDSINKLKAHATKKKGILEIIQEDYEIDFNSKSQWKPRDIDGHSIMQQPHPSWVLRSLKKKVK